MTPMIDLRLGDGIAAMRAMPDKSIDLIFTDPPYGHNNNNGDLISRWEAALGKGDYIPERDNIPIANDGAEANELYRAMLNEAKRILKNGCCCCCGGGEDPQFARWAMWMNEILHFKQMVIWDKGKMGMGWHYRRSYETVLVGYRNGAAVKWFDDSHKIENVIRPGDYGIKKIIPRADQHPTEKPIELAAHFIRLHSQPGDTVLDPFAGSGSTALAALRLERNFIGYEIDAKWHEYSHRRIAAAQLQPALAMP